MVTNARGRSKGGAPQRRRVALPKITYPENLPVSARRSDIATAIENHQVVIIAGETGSGKTTQIPKICLELGRGQEGQIGHTQPRRIAARTVAERIASELEVSLGQLIGYQVRFTKETGANTLVKVMTDGVLLAEIQRDPELRKYDTIIIDEAHERSLNIDFLLGYFTQLLPRRPDLKLIITSATIDSDRFADHFKDATGTPAPIVEVSGRTYPVEIRYRPLTSDTAEAEAGKKKKSEPIDQLTGIINGADELMAAGPGDILVFLSGEREIRDTAEALQDHFTNQQRSRPVGRREDIEILPLYSRLSAAEQQRVFQPSGRRRIVLATNVAETSLTVPGIRYVIDPGMARISRYAKGTKVQRLPIEPISQASANQRAGRCGRVAEGIAIRLYSEEDFTSRPEFTEPEILRTSLASVILQMISAGIAASPEEIGRFPFVEPPDARNIRDGVALLHELGAFDPDAPNPRRRLTKIGRLIARIPADPRLARMVVEAARRGVLEEVIVIAAALTIQDPRERPVEFQAQADQSHARFADAKSDFLTYLNLWRYLRRQRNALSGNAFRRMCRAEFINYLRVREWHDLVAQYRTIARETELIPADQRFSRNLPSLKPLGAGRRSGDEDSPETRWNWDGDAIHRALLPGLLSHVAMQLSTETAANAQRGGRDQRRARAVRNEYLGARGAKIAIFPGSRLSRKPPSWIMAAELVETSRLWARDVAAIDPAWVEEQGKHLTKRSYFEPFWSTKQGAAMAYERVLLFGLPIISRRRTLLARYEPTEARELFIRHALVEGEWRTHHKFFAHNQALLAEVTDVENRSRQRGLVADEDTLFDFYDERLPENIVSARHFDSWWKKQRRKQPELLNFTRELLLPDDSGIDADLFPDMWEQRGVPLQLTYQFEPGTASDGVTVHISITQLDRIEPAGFDWLVPGMREELITELIRSLPKAIRRELVPAPDAARDILDWIDSQPVGGADDPYSGPITVAISRAARALRDVEVAPADFAIQKLPAHLRVTFSVFDERDQVLGESKDLTELQRRFAAQSQSAVRTAVRSALQAALAEGGAGSAARGKGAAPTPADAPAVTHEVANLKDFGDALLAEQVNLTSWPQDLANGEIPQLVSTVAAGRTIEAYPALIDETKGLATSAAKGQVSLRLLSQSITQAAEHRRGVRRLLLLETGLPAARITSRWTGATALALAATPYPSTDALATDMQLAAVDALLTQVPWDGSGYEQVRGDVQNQIEDRVNRIVADVVQVLNASRELEATLKQNTSLAILNTLTDVREQHARLVYSGFVSAAGAEQLPHLARYLQAAIHRIEKAVEAPGRDESLSWVIGDLESEIQGLREKYAQAPPDPQRDKQLRDAAWMLEELRVQTFAQHLPTAQKTSEKRIRAALKALA